MLDLYLPEMNGLDLNDELVRSASRHPFIVVISHGEVPDATHAMGKGAIDFIIEWPLDRDSFMAGVCKAIEDDRQRCSAWAKNEKVPARLVALSPCERQVMQEMLEDKSRQQIVW